MSALGEFSNGPIQFNHNSGAIESRGTIDTPPASADAGPQTPLTSPAANGGGVLAYGDPSTAGPSAGFGGLSDEHDANVSGQDIDFGSRAPGADGMYGMGSYGGGQTVMGRTGIDGAAGAGDGTGTTMGFDDGGEVPGTDDEGDGAIGASQGASSSTFDPMQAISKVLAFGRQKGGLPANFSQGPSAGAPPQQGFDDGGEVQDQPDQGVIPSSPVTAGGNEPQEPQGGKLPDPRVALQYLTGGGAVSPDIAGALEKHVDPQGTMEPSRRTVAAILAAPNPDAAFGMMQHYRTQFNAYSGGARAALDQGNLGQAAVHATQAMQSVPTGYHVQFAPTQGGIAMTAKKLGAPAQQAPVQSAESGGLIDDEPNDRLPDQEESTNIDDRRGQTVEGYKPRQAVGLSGGPQQALADANKDTASKMGEGVIRKKKMQSFDDGGEVDEEPADQGVIPSQISPQPDDPSMDQPAAPQDDGGTDQPTVLTPAQFKKMMSDGYDKPLDDGFAGWLKSILSAVNPVGSAQAAEQTPGQASGFAPQTAQPAPAGAPQAPAANQGTTSGWQPTPSIIEALKADRAKQTAGTTQGQMTNDPAAQQTIAPKSKGDMAPGGGPGAGPQQGGRPGTPQPSPDDQRNARLQQYQQRFEQLAAKLYPWASQEDQRSQYIAGMMQKATESEFKQDQEVGRGRSQQAGQRLEGQMKLEQLRQQGRQQSNDQLETGRDTRNLRTNDTRREGFQTRENAVYLRQSRGEIERLIKVESAKGLKPDEVLANVAKYFNTTPQQIQQSMATQPGTRGQPQGQPQGQGQQPQGQPGMQQQFPRPSMKAVDYLRANPNSKSWYDKTYGPGSADKAMGN